MKRTGGQLDEVDYVILISAVVLSIVAVFAWTPLLGEIICRPITDAIAGDADVEEATLLLFGAHWLLKRKWRKLGILFCCWEALIHPTWPTPYYTAMRNCRHGGRLEVWFAERVWNGLNAHYCLEAREILRRRHGLDVPAHKDPAVRRLFAIWDQERKERKASPIELAKHVDKPPVRDERIALFDSEDAEDAAVVVPEAAVSLAVEDDDAVFVQPLDEEALSGRMRVSCRPAEQDEVHLDSLGDLIERDGVRIVFPTPGVGALA